MNPRDEKVELFRALEVKEVEERAQNVMLDVQQSSGSGSPY